MVGVQTTKGAVPMSAFTKTILGGLETIDAAQRTGTTDSLDGQASQLHQALFEYMTDAADSGGAAAERIEQSGASAPDLRPLADNFRNDAGELAPYAADDGVDRPNPQLQ